MSEADLNLVDRVCSDPALVRRVTTDDGYSRIGTWTQSVNYAQALLAVTCIAL